MIIIDAGHGGKDPGALGNGLKESDLTLHIATVMKRLCDIYQIPCRMTRTREEYVSLQQRTNFINSIAKDTTLIFQFESGFASDSLKRTLSKETLENIKAQNDNISYLDVMAMVSGAIRPAVSME